MANNGIYYSSGNTLNFTTNSTTWATLTSGGTFQMSAVSATTYYNLPPATFTGGTVSGATNFTGGLTANTISATTVSATTYYNYPGSSSANCVTTFFVTNISGCSPVNVVSPLNVQDGLSVTGTSTFTSQANFTGGLSTNTFSATTYQNLPSFNSVQINGTPQFSGDTNNFINFSGINITITSASTNTLVFSAATGGGGGGISGGGTTNYIPKFTGSTGIGNSQLQDDGSQVFTNQGYGSTLTGNLSINASGTTGIAGRATQYGVYGTISGATAGASGVYGEAGTGQYGIQGKGIGDVQIVVGVYGVATPDTGSGNGTLIGGRFSAGTTDEGAGYSLWLQDGTEGAGKYLQSETSDGKTRWKDFGYGFSFGGVSLTSTQVFATTTTTINTATYIDVAGCSVSLAAGTWLITGHVVIAAANLIIQGFVAITTAANTVVAASALSRPASGTPSLNSPFAVSWSVLVSPSATTTYKLRAARGLTTHTSTYTVYNGTGFNTASHANDGSNLGTNILAIRIA